MSPWVMKSIKKPICWYCCLFLLTCLLLGQDIGSRYPVWLKKHVGSLSPEDFTRYTRQHRHILDICHVYESCPDDFGAIYDKLQQVFALQSRPLQKSAAIDFVLLIMYHATDGLLCPYLWSVSFPYMSIKHAWALILCIYRVYVSCGHCFAMKYHCLHGCRCNHVGLLQKKLWGKCRQDWPLIALVCLVHLMAGAACNKVTQHAWML